MECVGVWSGYNWREMENKFFRSDNDYEILDIYEMFGYYNKFFFEERLDKCYVEWS